MQTLRRRDPLDFADVLIDRLREPVQYTVHPVGGPGRAGSLTIRGPEHDLRLIFAPPPPPDLLPMAGDEVLTDPQGGPILIRHTDSTGLPFAWLDKWRVIYPSGAFVVPHVPVAIALGAMWRENWKATAAARMQLREHAATLNSWNAAVHAENVRIVQILSEVTGQDLPASRQEWEAWWSRRVGHTRARAPEKQRSVLTAIVPPIYMPRRVGGLAYDPIIGYYVVAPAERELY